MPEFRTVAVAASTSAGLSLIRRSCQNQTIAVIEGVSQEAPRALRSEVQNGSSGLPGGQHTVTFAPLEYCSLLRIEERIVGNVRSLRYCEPF